MFKFVKKRVLKLPLLIPVAQDGGRVQKFEAEAEFEMLPQEAADAIYQAGGTDADLMKRVVVGWPEGAFQDEDGKPLLFNDENKALLFGQPNVRVAFTDAYVRASQGREAARKN